MLSCFVLLGVFASCAGVQGTSGVSFDSTHARTLNSLDALLRPLQIFLHVFCGSHAICKVDSSASESPLGQCL